MESRKYAEAILPLIKSQGKTVAEISKKLGKTESTVKTYITDCRKRGHDISKDTVNEKTVYRYKGKISQIKPVKITKFTDHDNVDHIDNKVNARIQFIGNSLKQKLGFAITDQQVILYGLHLADKDLHPEEFVD